MKIHLKYKHSSNRKLIFSVGFLILFLSHIRAQNCDNKLYLSQGNPTRLYEIRTNTNPFTYVPLGPTQSFAYNAMGFNKKDGFLYAMKTLPGSERGNIIRINPNTGATTNIGRPREVDINGNQVYESDGDIKYLAAINYFGGDFDDDGNYYIKPTGNRMFKIDLTTMTAVRMFFYGPSALPTWENPVDTNNPTPYNFFDLAFNSQDGLFYAIRVKDGKLISINPQTAVVVEIGDSHPPVDPDMETNQFGGIIASNTGIMYALHNGGGLYQINLSTGERTFISSSPETGVNDAAGCVNLIFETDLYVTKTDGKDSYIPGTTNTYTVEVGNEGPFGAQGVIVQDLVPAGIPAANVTYTASVTGGATTDVIGTRTGAINDSVDLPVGGKVIYTININIPATFTGDLVNAATITAPSNITDIDLSNNTATDTDEQSISNLCSEKVYLSQNSTGNPTQLYGVGTNTNPLSYNNIGTTSHGVTYNSTGYNPIDGYLYAIIYSNSNVVVKIHPETGNVVENLGPISGLPVTGYYAGEIDDTGNYYVKGTGNSLYRINLLTKTATEIPLSVGRTYYDLAYNINNGLLYGVAGGNGRLNSIDPSTGVVTEIWDAETVFPTGERQYGGMIGAAGVIYGFLNDGGFYRFNIDTGERTLISSSPTSFNNDAAHCVTAPLTFGIDLYVTKDDGKDNYAPGTTNVYTIEAGNLGPFGVQGATVKDLVPTGIPAANVSYVATTTGGATTSVVGTQTGNIEDLVNIPVGGKITYTVNIKIPGNYLTPLTNKVNISIPNTSESFHDIDLTNNEDEDTDTTDACYRPAATSGTTLDTKVGISALGRSGSDEIWPMSHKGAWIALEAKTKGFVVNRIPTTAQLNTIENPVEGMMVYDEEADCLKLYTTTDGIIYNWHCLNNQTCPSN